MARMRIALTVTVLALIAAPSLLLLHLLPPAAAREAVSAAGDFTPSAWSYLPIVSAAETPTPTPSPTPSGPPWLQYFNSFRAGTGLVVLVENSNWSYGGVLHSRYMVKNNVITHSENPGNTWYTPEGAAAGSNGNIMVSTSTSTPDETAIDFWMTAPFHAVSMLDPKLHTTGFGSYREADGGWQMGATLDVLRGRGSVPPGTVFPIPFPPAGGQTWLTHYWGGEWPNPLSNCGYSTPTGAPLMLQLGPGTITPSVTAVSLTRNGSAVPFCWYDETNYVNGDAGTQSTGRLILNSRDAVVVMPRDPLQVGATYAVAVTSNGNTTAWSFTVSTHPLRLAAPEPGTMEAR